MTSLFSAAAFVLLLQSAPAPTARIDGTWSVVDPGTGQQVGTMEIRPISGAEYSFKGEFKTTFAGGVPPAWLGSGKFSSGAGDYYWSSFDGREGRTTVRQQGNDRLLLEVRCMRGGCANNEFRYQATRSYGAPTTAPAGPVAPSRPAAPPAAPAAPNPSVRSWQEVRSAAGGFRVEFPTPPSYTENEVDDRVVGGKVLTHQWAGQLDNNWTAYVVGYSDLSQARVSSLGVDGTLSDAVKGALLNTGGTLQSETPIMVAGYPAREIYVSVPRDGAVYSVRARAILVNRRLFTLVALSHATNSRLEPGEFDRFLNSFRLIQAEPRQ
jgi:hypothetical protein